MTIVVSIGALLMSVFLLVAGNGLLGTTLAVRMNVGATSPQLIGLVLACYSVGFVAGALLAGHIISRVGHIRSFAAFGAFACTSVIVHSVADDLILWAVLRVVTGFSIASMFMVCESWLNERATNAVRGLMLSVYMITNYSAAGAGQFLLNAAPIEAPTLFMFAAILTVLSLVPLALTSSAQPQIPERRSYGLIKLYRVSPLGLVSALTVGIATGSFASMGPVFAGSVGLDIEQVGLFMGFGMLSGLVLQFPTGVLSDRVDRRMMILGGNAVGGLLGLAIFLIAWLDDGRTDFILLLVATCACMSVLYVLYPLCVAHANDFADPGQSTGVASGLIMVWGIGNILGPVLGSSVMSLFGPASLWLTVTVLMGGTAGYAAWRMGRRPTVDDTIPYVAAPAMATPVSVELDPRTEPAESVRPPTVEPVGPPPMAARPVAPEPDSDRATAGAADAGPDDAARADGNVAGTPDGKDERR